MSVGSVPLGDVATFVRGITYKPTDLLQNFSEGSIVCMRTANVQAVLADSDVLSIPRSFVKDGQKILREGDLLVSSANSWNLVGKCCWVPALTYEATVGGFIAALRGNQKKVDARYLYRWFSSPKTQSNVRNCGRQTTNISNMDFGRCLELKIPLPSLSEQRRIAVILDKADVLRAKRREAIAKLDQLLQSVFLDMFGDPTINPRGLATATLEEVSDQSDRINYGVVQPGIEVAGGIPLVRIGNILGGKLDAASIKRIDPEIESTYVRSRLKGNELLISCVGSIGTVAMVSEEAIGFNIARAITRVPIKDANQRAFLQSCLRSQGVQRYFQEKTRTVSQPTLNVEFVKQAQILVPPVEEQERFAGIAARVEQRTREMRKSMEQLVTLFDNLQHRAFAGTL